MVDCPCCLGDGDHCDPDFPGCSECNSAGKVQEMHRAHWEAGAENGHRSYVARYGPPPTLPAWVVRGMVDSVFR